MVETAPRLPDGTPFPTLFYLTCPRATAAMSRLEAAGLMREMTARLGTDSELRSAQISAHKVYAALRATAAAQAGVDPLPEGSPTAGGMPDRVKCLHALAAHELAVAGQQPARRGGPGGRRAVVGARPVRAARMSAGSVPPGPVRVAAIDCGTNSLRLLVADVDTGLRRLADVVRRMEIVRLGQGVDATGRLAPDALDRTLHTLGEYADIIHRSGATSVRMVATSATRDAANAAEFSAAVMMILGQPPEVLTGGEEAALSFAGATAELAGGPALPGPYLVVDIGGGSTEFVLGDAAPPKDGDGNGLAACSMDIGCVRMTERHLHDDPPTAAQIEAASADIDAAIAEAAAAVHADRARTLVGLAGSVTTVAGIALELPAYDPEKIHHARITADQVHEVTQSLLSRTVAQRREIGVMHPGRADVIGAGALVLDRIMTDLGFAEVIASEHDILDGIAWSLARS